MTILTSASVSIKKPSFQTLSIPFLAYFFSQIINFWLCFYNIRFHADNQLITHYWLLTVLHLNELCMYYFTNAAVSQLQHHSFSIFMNLSAVN
jgi:hypothetical protein